MKIITEPLTLQELKRMAANMFGDMVKAVVDVERGIFAIDAELHADLEAHLLKNGSRQKSLWGINLYPEIQGDDFIESEKMKYQHQQLAQGRWSQLSFLEQMANIGSEVERALNWRAKKNSDYSQKAFERALELVDLSLECVTEESRLKELARTREAMADFFMGSNQYGSTEGSWKKYFLAFAYAARR